MKNYIAVVGLLCMISSCAIIHNKNFAYGNFSEKNDQPEYYSAIGNQPSGLNTADRNTVSSEIFLVEGIIPEQNNVKTELIDISRFNIEEKDSTETEPTLQPLVLIGTATAVIGLGAAVAGALFSPILLAVAGGLFIISALVTAIGWKKIKKDPKKYKGEKFATASYLIIGLVGVVASFYLLYLLFSF